MKFEVQAISNFKLQISNLIIMNIKILTPELVVFEGEVESILLPGELGEFHIMNDHAPVVSSLRTGKVKLITKGIEDESFAKFFTKEPQRNNCYTYPINGGVIEFNHNSGIILCD